MELPKPRPFETEGRKPTHDFLSLYSHSTVRQDPRPPSQGGYLKTHDFLQPLEHVGKGNAKEETSSVDTSASEKLPPPAPPPPILDQHVLPGGIGTYTISHISCFNQRVPKPEVSPMFTVAQASSNERNTDDNSNCSSFGGSGFTLWEESVGKKGQTRKENVAERSNIREAAAKMGQWTPSERPSQSSTNNHRNSLSSLSSSQGYGQKSQSFMEMLRSAKVSNHDDDFDDDEEFDIKKESSSSTQKMDDLRVKVEGKSSGIDQKPNTPRSKHSATEQRRRSKINDRFQMLRQLIPNSDQKRDKASFLLEVIEHIQILQEKVNKYEGSYQGFHHEQVKQINWRNNQRPGENYIDQPRGTESGSAPSIVLGSKLDEKNVPISQTLLANAPNHADQSNMASKAMNPFPLSLHPNFFSPIPNGSTASQVSTRVASAAETNSTSGTQTQPCPLRSNTTDVPVDSDKVKEQELGVEGGTISISSVYSQGLLKTLTQALQSSGVDLSQASISVQIELGKRVKDKTTSSPSTIKDNEIPCMNQRMTRSRVESGNDFYQDPKKLKTDRR